MTRCKLCGEPQEQHSPVGDILFCGCGDATAYYYGGFSVKPLPPTYTPDTGAEPMTEHENFIVEDRREAGPSTELVSLCEMPQYVPFQYDLTSAMYIKVEGGVILRITDDDNRPCRPVAAGPVSYPSAVQLSSEVHYNLRRDLTVRLIIEGTK